MRIGRTAFNNLPPGLNPLIYFADMEDVDVANFPGLDATGTETENLATLDKAADIAFNATPTGLGFHEIQARANRNLYNSIMQGEDLGSVNQVEFYYKGTEANILGLREYLTGKDLIVLVNDKCGGETKCFGQPCSPAKLVEFEAQSGAAAGDEREVKIVIAFEGSVPLSYFGAITLAT